MMSLKHVSLVEISGEGEDQFSQELPSSSATYIYKHKYNGG